MRRLMLIFSLTAGPPGRADDGWFSPDKAQHFFSSAFVQSLGYGLLRRTGVGHGAALAGASVTTAAVGIGKEVHDARTGGDPSVKDLVWDAAGAGAISMVLGHSAR